MSRDDIARECLAEIARKGCVVGFKGGTLCFTPSPGVDVLMKMGQCAPELQALVRQRMTQAAVSPAAE